MKIKKILATFLTVIVLGLGSGQDVDAKGIFGSTDVINIPTNRVLSSGAYSLGAHIDEHSRGKIQIDLGLEVES